MKRVTFSGHSDDVVCFSDGEKSDEVGAIDASRRFLVGEFERGVIVSLRYADKWHEEPSWTISVVPSAEDERGVPSIPEGWTVGFENGDRSYSMVLVITCPDETRVRRLSKAKRERDKLALSGLLAKAGAK